MTYTGPSIDNPELLKEVPPDLVAVVRETNGIVAFSGGLHQQVPNVQTTAELGSGDLSNKGLQTKG
ncbi:MAG TPA: hypothetical protein VGL59_13845 [Polyangia bacterium]